MSDLLRNALGALESLINRALSFDPATREQLRALDGQRFRLNCTQPAFSAVLIVRGDQLLLQTDSDKTFSTELTGSWDEFAGVALAEDPATALINGNVQVRGSTEPVLELRRILADLDIDWEQPLARIIGDVAAHQIGRGLRGGGKWALQAMQSLRRQVGEFLVEESGWVPHPIEVEDFYRGVEELAARTDRLEARLRSLSQRLRPATSERG